MQLHSFRLKIKHSELFLVVCLIGYMKPACVAAYPILDIFFDLSRVIATGLIMWIVFQNSVQLTLATKLICIFETYYLFITFIRFGDVRQAVIGALTVIGEILLFEIGIKWNLKDFLKILSFILCIYVILNLITVIIVPGGFFTTEKGTPVYFLGIPNRFVFWMLPLICFLCVLEHLSKTRLPYKIYIIYLLCLATLIMKGAAGAIIGMTLLMIYFFFAEKRKFFLADYRAYLLVYFALWISLTFFDTIGLWSWLTYGIFGKSTSLAARLSLWERGKNYLLTDISYLLFGFGLEISSIIESKFWYIHLHNNLLNVIYQTGIIGSLLYISPLFAIISTAKKYKYNKICQVTTFTIFSFLIMLLMDTYDLYGHFYTIIVLVANMDAISKKQDPLLTCTI